MKHALTHAQKPNMRDLPDRRMEIRALRGVLAPSTRAERRWRGRPAEEADEMI